MLRSSVNSEGGDPYDTKEVAQWLATLPVFPGEQVLLAEMANRRLKRAIDIGAGSGRLYAELNRLGFTYRAIDPSQFLVEDLVRRHPGADASVGRGDSLPWGTSTADLALLAFHVIEAIRPHEVRLATLREVHRVLEDGGTLLISHHRAWRYRPLKQALHWVGGVRHGAEFGDFTLAGTPKTGGVDIGSLPMHIPRRRELDRLAREAGFERRMVVPFAERSNWFSRLFSRAVLEEWKAV